MSAFLNVNEIKEKVSLLSLLKNLGFSPQKQSGGEHFFLSMLREEYTASLCVNDDLGVWYDHGGAGVSGIRSGSIIDFGLAYWYPSTFPEVLRKILEYSKVELENSSQLNNSVPARLQPVKVPNYKIEAINESIKKDALNAYLKSREIISVAKDHLYELHYSVLDSKNKHKNFFASGWPNENGGWEVRNKYFKGCLGHKGMSFLQGATDKLCVFEGYFDFLSWRVENSNDPSSVLVLNSLSFLQSAMVRAKQFSAIQVYFDHDKAGISATHDFIINVSGSQDFSFKYLGHKDYNAKLVTDANAAVEQKFAQLKFSTEIGFIPER
ncbi:toprim domain-containing protein [Pedobacter endophyticus]|uniref:Toprim domain-containing protein n=1 Tax=Pedobacter endophyticus TaxID=2789740 RepID=A0A7U3Q542_9SPHI|nr:toprim domain-containing protein [Pedobacter endophyticus]QPH38727.1 toprim domain-containing protein [Pedobacter endophyticus]